jgi:hypothetical protein
LALVIFFASVVAATAGFTTDFLDRALERFVDGTRVLAAARIDAGFFGVPELLEAEEACFLDFLDDFIEREI